MFGLYTASSLVNMMVIGDVLGELPPFVNNHADVRGERFFIAMVIMGAHE